MLYLVEMIQDREMPLDSAAYDNIKERVCRSLETLAEHPQVRGGIRAGGRSIVFVIEAEDNEDLDRQLQNLPLWDVAERTEVTPLVSFEARLGYNRSS